VSELNRSALEGGADPNAHDVRDKETALPYAAAAGDLSLAKILIAHKADIDARSGLSEDPQSTAQQRIVAST
jgi:hypothetical protein